MWYTNCLRAKYEIIMSIVTIINSCNDDEKDVSFLRLGSHINVVLRDLKVIGGFITGMDEDYYNPTGTTGKVKFDRKYDLLFGEANYMIYPWLVGAIRYELVNPQDIHIGLDDQELFNSVPGISSMQLLFTQLIASFS